MQYALSFLFTDDKDAEFRAQANAFIANVSRIAKAQEKAHGTEFFDKHIEHWMNELAKKHRLGLVVTKGLEERIYFIFHTGLTEKQILEAVAMRDHIRVLTTTPAEQMGQA